MLVGNLVVSVGRVTVATDSSQPGDRAVEVGTGAFG